MKRAILTVMLLALAASAAMGQVPQDPTVGATVGRHLIDLSIRRAPYRRAGLDLTGRSLANFASEPRFAFALRKLFGFTESEVGQGITAAKSGQFTIVQFAPGLYDTHMAGAPGRWVHYDGLAFWLTSLRVTVGEKHADFLTVCGNPIWITGGEVVTTSRVEYRDRDVVRERRVEVVGPEQIVYRDRPIVKIVTIAVPIPIGGCCEAPPVFREGQAISLGTIETRSSQAVVLGIVLGTGTERLNTCPPGVGPPPPGNGGPPNPQGGNEDPTLQIGPPPPRR